MNQLTSLSRNVLSAAAIATLALGAATASAQSSTPGQTFTVNAPTGSFQANAVDFSYRADVTQTGTGDNTASFVETGAGFFSTFQLGIGSPVFGSGLNSDYKLYAEFVGTGNVAQTGAIVEGDFTTFNLTVRLDPQGDTNFTSQTSRLLVGTGNDLTVLTGTLSQGEFRVDTSGLENGGFDVLLNVQTVGSFFAGAAFANGMSLADFNGVNSFITGLSIPGEGASNSVRIEGSGNLTVAAIPEPETYALMLAGLGVVGFMARRRKNRDA